jgi:hypothetical protein
MPFPDRDTGGGANEMPRLLRDYQLVCDAVKLILTVNVDHCVLLNPLVSLLLAETQQPVN